MSSQLKKQIKKQTKKTNKVIKLIKKKGQPRTIRGRGGYFDDFKKNISNVWNNLNEDQRPEASSFNKYANKIGQVIGSEFGIGKQMGNAGSWLSRVFGMGKYTVKRNSLMHENGAGIVAGMNSASPPVFGSSGKGSDIYFSHREFVADVKSSVSFTKTSYPINPGNPLLFPWMSQIASLYEEYEMLGMLMEYKSSSGTSNTAAVPGMGLVLMATDYDPYDNSFNSKRQMEAAEFSSSGVPYANFLHAIECDPRRNVLRTQYVQPGITDYSQAPGDARFSVLGNFTIATVGQPAQEVTMGELWVTYHIRLSRPVLEYANQRFSQHIWGLVEPSTGLYALNEKTTTGAVAFTNISSLTGSSMRLLIDNTLNRYTGYFRITYIIVHVPGGAVLDPIDPNTTVTGATLVADLKTNTRYHDARAASEQAFGYGTYRNIISTTVVNITQAGGCVIDIPLLNYVTESTNIDIFIDRVDNSIYDPALAVSSYSSKVLSADSQDGELQKIGEESFLNRKDNGQTINSSSSNSKNIFRTIDNNNTTQKNNKELVKKIALNNKDGWILTEEKEFLSSFLNQLEKDNIEHYDVELCNDKLDIIKELITMEIPDSHMNVLLQKMKQICSRLRNLQD